jgi:hypothetical protein
MDRFAKYNAIAGALRNQPCDLELVTRLHLNDGTTQEISNVRRVICKKASRKRGSTVFTFADLDLAALDQIFPFETFTVADWPNLFVDDVGKRVPQGVGTARKVPLALIDTDNLTFWTYAGPKVIGTAATLLTLYRGSQADQGAIVSGSEYTTATRTAPSGYQVVTHTFAREQIDFQGRQYILEADYVLPGSRIPADETARVLAAFGISTDSTSFTAAATYDAVNSFVIDALYGGAGRTGRAIIADLCDAARAWLTPTATGTWAITQDSPRSSTAQFDTSADLIQIDEYGDADVPAKVTLFYRPKASLGEDWAAPLSRPTAGSSSEMQRHNPYIYAHAVADFYLSYWQKRLNATLGPTGGVAKGTVYAAQVSSGDRITVTDALAYLGTKDFIAPGVTRGADSNQLTLREYVADVYVYAAGTLPADATNGYSPDYSFTPPLAPTIQAIGAGGTSTDADGKVRARQLIQLAPPGNTNWALLTVQLTDVSTNEIYQAQATLNAGTGFYEVVVANLPPARSMQARAWATNSNNVTGATAGPTSFTSATSAAVPSTPASITITQTHSFQLDYAWAASTPGAAPILEYVLEQSPNAGASWTEVFRGRSLKESITAGIITGTNFEGRVKARDTLGNESAYATSTQFTAQKMIDDTHIIGGGVNGPSIGGGAISQGQANTSTGTFSGTLGAGVQQTLILQKYLFWPQLSTPGSDNKVYITADQVGVPVGTGDAATIGIYNSGTLAATKQGFYRYIVP